MADQENINPIDLLVEDQIATLVRGINARNTGKLRVEPDAGGYQVGFVSDEGDIVARYLSPNQTLQVIKLINETC